MVTTPPEQLDPRQWQCHRDRVSTDPGAIYVASVLYLFRDPALGGTSFYVPRQSPAATDRIQYDSQTLAPPPLVDRNISMNLFQLLGVLADRGPQAVSVQHLDVAFHRLAGAAGHHGPALVVDVEHQFLGLRPGITETDLSMIF